MLKILGSILIFVSLAFLSGCASTDLSKYSKLTSAADTYVESYLGVIEITANASIENSSLEVIEYHLNKSESERTEQFLSDALINFERSYDQTKSRLDDLGLLSEHLKLFQNYFRKLAAFAGNQTAEETEAAIKSSAEQVNTLVGKLMGDDNQSVIKNDQLSDLSTLSNYVFKIKTAKTLEQTIKADLEYLSENILLHQRTFDTISAIIQTEFGGANELKRRFDLEEPLNTIKNPFTNKQQRQQWMNDRRQILLTSFNSEPLKNTSRAAKKFNDALKAISNNPTTSTAQLDAFLTEVEGLKKVVDSIRD